MPRGTGMRMWVGWLNDLFYYAWVGSVLWKCKHETSVDLPKLLVLTCSCLACPLVGVGPYGWQCSLMESPCAVSLIVVDSFTMFTVRCCYVVNWVFCLLCGWIFHSVICGTARLLLYCWSEFYYVEFLLYRGVLCYVHYVCGCLFCPCGGVFCLNLRVSASNINTITQNTLLEPLLW